MEKITINEFNNLEFRIGTIINVDIFKEAIKPAYKIIVDLGEKIGKKQSSAQINKLYSKKELMGKQVLVVVNLYPKQIGPFVSECLITGFYNEENKVVLAVPDKKISNGSLLM